MSFLNGLTKGLGIVEGVLPFVNNTVSSVETLLGGAPGSTKKAAAMQIIGSGLSVAATATGAPAEAIAAALNAVSPLIDSVVSLKNLFGEFGKSSAPASAATASAGGPAGQ
jgi:spore maturation protein SpmB